MAQYTLQCARFGWFASHGHCGRITAQHLLLTVLLHKQPVIYLSVMGPAAAAPACAAQRRGWIRQLPLPLLPLPLLPPSAAQPPPGVP